MNRAFVVFNKMLESQLGVQWNLLWDLGSGLFIFVSLVEVFKDFVEKFFAHRLSVRCKQ